MNQLNAIVNLQRRLWIRANHTSYITKRLRKAKMKRSELKSRYLKIKTQESFKYH